MSQINSLFEKMAAQAKAAKPLVSTTSERSSGVLTIRSGKDTRSLFDVEQFGESFQGFITTPNIRLAEVRGYWQAVGANGRAATEENPGVRAELIVRFSLRLSGEQIGRVLPDGTDELLPAYALDADALVQWRDRVHSIEGRIWGASPEVISKITFDLVGKHGFSIKKNVPPRGENAEERRETLFICTTPTPLDVNGEPVWVKRGAPVTSFGIGLPPASRNGDQAEVGQYNDTDRGARFLNLWCGTLQSTEAMLEASVANDEDEKRRMRGVMYSLTGYRAWDGNDGPVYGAKEAPLTQVTLGKSDYHKPTTSDASYALRSGGDDKVGMTVDEMVAKNPITGQRTERKPAGSENRFDDEE